MPLQNNLVSYRGRSRFRQRVAGYLNPGLPPAPQAAGAFSEDIKGRLFRYLTHIIRTFDCRESPGYFPGAIMLLESVPLSNDEMLLARSRIDNAQRYADAEEPGAAIYELRILISRLRQQA